MGWSGAYCVTAYVGNVRFTRSIAPGCLVELEARIIQTGRTSMQVRVTVHAADVATRERHHALDCLLVFVAVDEQRRPQEVPQWSPSDNLGEVLQRRAEERLEVRKAIRDITLKQSYSERGTTPHSRFRFLVAPGDANWGGNAHGGTVMRWIHDAAYSVAAVWAGADNRAVYSGGIHFVRPVRIGAIVEIDARIIHVDDQGMHIATRVSSAPVEAPDRLALTTISMSVYRHSEDGDGPRSIAPLELRSDEDERLHAYALEVIALRRRLKDLPI